MKLKYIIILVLFSLLFCCKQVTSPWLYVSNDCSAFTEDSTLNKQIFPFHESTYNTSEMRKYFKIDVRIDSSFNILSNGDTIYYYRYHDSLSNIIFSLASSNEIQDYSIASFHFENDFMKSNNDIEYGITRNELFDLINIKKVNCDTIDLIFKSKGYYYKFVLHDNILTMFSKKYIEL